VPTGRRVASSSMFLLIEERHRQAKSQISAFSSQKQTQLAHLLFKHVVAIGRYDNAVSCRFHYLN
jgi:hypothetical protein